MPAVSTCTLLSTVREMLSRSALTVTTTSTRVPGTVKPATPMTSLTFTDMARMPGVIVAARPPPAFFGASLFSVIGSFSTSPDVTPRPITSSADPNPPVTGWSAGHGTARTISLVSSMPTGMLWPATTWKRSAIGTCFTGIC